MERIMREMMLHVRIFGGWQWRILLVARRPNAMNVLVNAAAADMAGLIASNLQVINPAPRGKCSDLALIKIGAMLRIRNQQTLVVIGRLQERMRR
ncbi:hypothetical protein GCM10009780_80420 [Actinomadura alba]